MGSDALSPVAVDAVVAVAATTMVDDDPTTRTDWAAAWVADALGQVLARQDRAVLGLVGGTSVAGIHAALVDHQVDWDRVVVVPADERAVPTDSDERNWRVVEPLVDPLVAAGRLPADNVVALPDLPDDATPAQAEDALDQVRARVDRVDVALLSAGPDGHCASLFPQHPALAATGTFAVVQDAPKPPPLRITMTVPMLAGADAIMLVATGAAKSDAVAAVAADGPLSAAPARVVHLARRGVVVTDQFPGSA